MTRVAIVGTGDQSHALCHLYKNYNTSSSGNYLEVTKPSIKKGGDTLHDTGVLVSEIEDSLHRADVVVLAIPAAALKVFVSDHLQILKDKILVDVTNSWIPGEDLNSLLSITDVRFVKAFNDLGAVDLLLDKPSSKNKIQCKICSKYVDAANVVKDFAEESLGMDVKVIPYERYLDIAQHQQTLGDSWMKSTYVILVIFVIAEVYALLRYNVFKGYDWYHLLLQVTNKAVCWTALNGFAVAQTPGIFARLSNMIYGDTMRTKPTWLRSFLAIRKHLGILSLWFLIIHILMSLILFNPGYYSKFFLEKDGTSKMNAIGESSFFFAVFGTGFYLILGLCSLPSVGTQMTNRQWQLIYGPLAWIALICGTVHVMIMGVKGWSNQESWPGGMPPITMTSVLIPLTVMTIKFVQVLSKYMIAWCLDETSTGGYPELKVMNMAEPNLVDDAMSRRTLSSDENLQESTSRAIVPAVFPNNQTQFVSSANTGTTSPSRKSKKPSTRKLPSKKEMSQTSRSEDSSFVLPD